jgi:hypothetical protein
MNLPFRFDPNINGSFVFWLLSCTDDVWMSVENEQSAWLGALMAATLASTCARDGGVGVGAPPHTYSEVPHPGGLGGGDGAPPHTYSEVPQLWAVDVPGYIIARLAITIDACTRFTRMGVCFIVVNI